MVEEPMSFRPLRYSVNLSEDEGLKEDPYQKYLELCKNQDDDLSEFILIEQALNKDFKQNQS